MADATEPNRPAVAFLRHIGDGTFEHSEEGLRGLLEFIRGDGVLRMGPWIHTYPTGNENQRRIYEGCCILELRGLVTRTKATPDHVVFQPAASVRE